MKLTGQRRRLFLSTLAATGNVAAAARAAGVARSTCYRTRHVDQDFAQAWLDAEDDAFDDVVGSIRRRAVHGDERPLVVGGKLVKDDDGKVVMIREYDNKLVELYLRMLAPEKFRDKTEIGGKTARGQLSLPPVQIVIANDVEPGPARQARLRAADGGD